MSNTDAFSKTSSVCADQDVLKAALVPVSPPDEMLSFGLTQLIQTALAFFSKIYPAHPFYPAKGLIKQLEDLAGHEHEAGKKEAILYCARNLRAYFQLANPNEPGTLSGKICLFSDSKRQMLYLMMTPPRGLGNMPTEGLIATALNRTAIHIPHDELFAMIEEALRTVRQNQDVVWGLALKRGIPPKPPCQDVEFQVPIIDKQSFMRALQQIPDMLTPLWQPVAEGQAIGKIKIIDSGSAGRDIFGKTIPPPRSECNLDLGDDFSLSEQGGLSAKFPGYVIREAGRLDIVPFYVMDNPPPGSVSDFSFPGNVLVRGNLQGPGAIECEDLIVLGNCEQINVTARGDVFVVGGIIGHRQMTMDADGRIYASFISEATISALGEIVALNAILNSQLTSNMIVRVTSPKGLIAGGRICSLKDICAAMIGSEFGLLTETVVGKDFLTESRLAEISRRIALHENNLNRIQQLKRQLVASHVPIERMAPDKQEIFLNILRKEQSSQAELKSSLRRKKTLSHGLREVISAGISVLDKLYPPVRVQIGGVFREIGEKLEKVSLRYDQIQGEIVTNPLDNKETML